MPTQDTTDEVNTDETGSDTTDEPTGADGNGEVDVASDTDETVPTDAAPAESDDSDSEPEPDTEESPTGEDTPASAVLTGKRAQDLADRLTALVDECKFRFTDEGLSVRAVDPANVAMIDILLEKGAFNSYEGSALLGINLSRFSDIVDMADKEDLIFLDYDLETRTMEISFDGLEYTLALIDPDSIRQEPDIPSLDLPAEVVVEADHIRRGITAADMVSDHIRFRVDPRSETFHIEAEGDTDDVDLELHREDLLDVTLGDADSLFSLEYLKDLFKPIERQDEVTLELGEEFPVKAHTKFADDFGQQTVMVAPRIQSD